MNEANENDMSFVLFSVAAAFYGLDVSVVDCGVLAPELIPCIEPTPLVRGFCNLKGRMIPVIDLAERLGLGPTLIKLTSVLLVVSTGDVEEGSGRLALLVDRAYQVATSRRDQVKPLPRLKGPGGVEQKGLVISMTYWEGELVRLLDPTALLTLWDGPDERSAGNELALTENRDKGSRLLSPEEERRLETLLRQIREES